uniref:hypothetical protein n=1 Tax=Rhizobium sp. H4 TaxID=2035449 RepID=UPI001AECCF8F
MTESEGCGRAKFAVGTADEVSRFRVEEGAIPGTGTRPAVRYVDGSFGGYTPPTSVIPGLEPGIQSGAVNEPIRPRRESPPPKDLGALVTGMREQEEMRPVYC